MDLGLKDKVVVVTGGGSGLGKAGAAEFGRLGGAVAIASRVPGRRARGVCGDARRVLGASARAVRGQCGASAAPVQPLTSRAARGVSAR